MSSTFNDNNFIGIVTASDIQKENNTDLPVSCLCKYPEVVSNELDTLLDLINIFDRDNLSYLPVLNDNKKLVGIITKSSLVTALSQQYIDEKEDKLNA